MRRRLGLPLLTGAVAAVVAVAVAGSGGTARARGPAGAGGTPVERVLIVSLPAVTWEDLAAAEVPHLRGLLRESALASASLRVFHRQTPAGEGYATIAAGALMNGHRRLTAIAQADPAGGGILAPATRVLADLAAERRNGAEVGALGDSLARAGVGRAVVANADTSATDPAESTWHREAAIALAGSDGRLPGGDVSRGLLTADAGAPFGVRLDPDAVRAAFRSVWRGRAVVLVEASDTARAQLAAAAGGSRRDDLMGGALASTDALVGSLLGDVDPGRHAVILVTPSTPAPDVRLGVAAVRKPGAGGGLLRSASTRRSGFITLADIAPTVLALLDVPRPSAMDGRAVEVGRDGPVDLAELVQADTESRFRDRLLEPVTLVFVASEAALALAAAGALAWGRRRRLRGAVAFSALWLLAALGAAWLPASLDVTTSPVWAGVVIGGGLSAALVAYRWRRPLHRVALVLGMLFSLLVVDVMSGWGLQLSAVFGYSPTAGGRFAGVGNLAFAQLAAAATLLAAALAHLVGSRRGAWVGVTVLGLAVVADGLPAWGSDVGGVLAGLPGFAVVAAGLLGVHISAAWVLGLAGGSVLLAAGFGALDLARPPAERTHLGRLLERIGNEGFDPLRDAIARKADVAWDLALPAARRWLALLPVGLGFLAYLSWGRRPALRRLAIGMPQLLPAIAGLLVVAALGFALNDSGVAVPAMMLGVLNPVLVHLALGDEAPAGA